ncbi:hypothetical protein, partial [Pseudomonas aeruginosa]|uniref:hypothetical protein n=1 Tax=Pseudomonas aeruginosa TaxID=287 RepID=UPI0015C4F7DA
MHPGENVGEKGNIHGVSSGAIENDPSGQHRGDEQHHVADDGEFFGVFGQTDIEALAEGGKVPTRQGAAASAQVNIELGSEDAFEFALQFLEVLLRLGDGVVVFLDGLVEGALLRLFQATPAGAVAAIATGPAAGAGPVTIAAATAVTAGRGAAVTALSLISFSLFPPLPPSPLRCSAVMIKNNNYLHIVFALHYFDSVIV